MAAVIKIKILDLLEKYNQGLSIDDVARFLKISRTTAAKYLEVLVETDKIKRREVGNTKLHYPPQHFKEIKFSIIFLLAGFFVFQMFAADGIAMFDFNLIFQEIFVQALQTMLFVTISVFVGVFSICRIVAGYCTIRYKYLYSGTKS